MNCRAWLVAALVLFLPAAYAAESGYTLKPIEVKDKPFLDAVTVVTLPEKIQVEILKQTLANLREPTQAEEIEIGDGVAAPGGYIIVTRGMMKELRNEAELAGVLGHEVAHVTQKHHLKALRKSAVVNLLGAGAVAATAESRHAEVVQKLAGPTKELYARGLDKADEFEADRMGVVLAARAGYDPYGLPAVLTTLASADPKDNFLTLLAKTHPLPQVRLDSLAPGLATLDGIKAPQIPTRFQQYTRKLQLTFR